jgi:hypothetical protein
MAVIAAQGLQLSIASAFGSQFTISALTNASEGVATLSASHGVTVGDLIEITSGWKRLNQRVVRAKTVATNDVTLESVNTTSTTDYPAGEGVGTGREITTWTSISQLTPLFNMNTLVVVLLGLWLFKEHRHVRPAPLVIGAALVILGAVLVARA